MAKTLREACEAVIAEWDSEGDVCSAQDDLHRALGQRPEYVENEEYDMSERILAALDSEREAGRREALEEVRAWLDAHTSATIARYKVPGDHDTWDEYRQGQADGADILFCAFGHHFPKEPNHD